LRLFGKPEVAGKRRMGVALARDLNTDQARAKALRSATAVKITLWSDASASLWETRRSLCVWRGFIQSNDRP